MNVTEQPYRIHGVFQDVHESWEPGCDKRGVNDTYSDTIIPHVGAFS